MSSWSESQKTEHVVFRSAKPPNISAESKLLNKMFTLSGTGKEQSGRGYSAGIVVGLLRLYKITVKQKKIEDDIVGLKDDTAYDFLSSVSQLLDSDTPVPLQLDDEETDTPSATEVSSMQAALPDAPPRQTVELDQTLMDNDAGQILADCQSDNDESGEEIYTIPEPRRRQKERERDWEN